MGNVTDKRPAVAVSKPDRPTGPAHSDTVVGLNPTPTLGAFKALCLGSCDAINDSLPALFTAGLTHALPQLPLAHVISLPLLGCKSAYQLSRSGDSLLSACGEERFCAMRGLAQGVLGTALVADSLGFIPYHPTFSRGLRIAHSAFVICSLASAGLAALRKIRAGLQGKHSPLRDRVRSSLAGCIQGATILVSATTLARRKQGIALPDKTKAAETPVDPDACQLRLSVVPSHAFTTLDCPNARAISRGFYPRGEIEVEQFHRDATGATYDDSSLDELCSISWCARAHFELTAEKAERVKEFFRQEEEACLKGKASCSYKALTRNCIHFVDRAASYAGLPADWASYLRVKLPKTIHLSEIFEKTTLGLAWQFLAAKRGTRLFAQAFTELGGRMLWSSE